VPDVARDGGQQRHIEANQQVHGNAGLLELVSGVEDVTSAARVADENNRTWQPSGALLAHQVLA
jgi:hypothetical protein